ncbi:MAG: hypothetical protein A3K19_13820 [Lentisphaerae bacterium RIFOXYB12_FULL_65_16]|nr:MAG: hypothetical protein A3K18_06415 [Lentisphaerae bacterium RIFOXYA12_64_32]OGV84236.1 MAG: hypothetical protein A3K19_13820 [Lentisphaerae bacterium RIFOXYB12_FULL_65_16]
MRSAARVLVLCVVVAFPCLAGEGATPPQAKAVVCSGEVRIDGNLSDAAWAAAEWAGGFVWANEGDQTRGAPKPAPVQTRFKVMYDRAALYIGVECDEPNPERIRAEVTGHDGLVWGDDCIEIFFDPAGVGRYFHHFLVNSKGAWYDEYAADYGLVHNRLWNCAIGAAGAVDTAAKKWTCEVRIPFGGLLLQSNAGKDWLWNLTRERYAGGGQELSSWSPLKGNFHQPQLFGKVSGIAVDYAPFALELGEPSVAVAAGGSGVKTLGITVPVRNRTGAGVSILATSGVFGEKGAPVAAAPVEAADGAEVTIQFPPLQVRADLGEANLQLTFNDAKTGELRKSVIRQVSADYRPVTVTLLEPCYRNCIYASETVETLVFRVALAPDVGNSAASVHCALLNEGGQALQETDVQPAALAGKITLPVAALQVGAYRLAVQARNAAGKALANSETVVRRLPPPPSGCEVRIDRDGNILVNGKPFVGIGWYGEVPLDDPRQDVIALQNVVTPVVINPPKTEPVGKLFTERGIRSFVSIEIGRLYYSFNLWQKKEEGDAFVKEPTQLSAPSEKAVGYMRQLIEAVRGEPGLLGYYIADEPEINNVRSDYLENMYKVIAELDPYHPVMVTNDTLDGIVTHGFKCADILGPDPYSPQLEYVPNFMKRCHAVMRSGQAIMLTPWHSSAQAHFTKEYGTEPPYPYRVMRNQFLVSLAYGCRGWTGYASAFFMPEIELRYGLPPIWRELRFIEKAMGVSPPEAPLEIEADADLAGWIREADGNLYLVVVNYRAGVRSATLKHPLLGKVQRLTVVSEGRDVEVKDGAVTDRFAEGDARIYTTDPKGKDFPTTQAVEAELARLTKETAKPGNLLHASRGVHAAASSGYYAPWFNQYYYYAINGVTDDLGWYASHAGGKPAWLELALREPAPVGRVVIYSPNLKDYALRIQSPGGVTYEAEVKGNDKTVIEHNLSPPVTCLALRITATAARELPPPANRAPQVSEIEAYEAPGAGPVTALVRNEVALPVVCSPIPRAADVGTNALWEDNFTTFQPKPKFFWDGKDTEWVFGPEVFKAVALPGGGVECGYIGPEGGAGMSHFFPCAPEYRFLQVSIRDIEGGPYRFIHVGYRPNSDKYPCPAAANTNLPGIYTVDTHFLNDAFRSGEVKASLLNFYMCKVRATINWVRLVKRPVNGLAVMLADGNPLPKVLKKGDTLLFHLVLAEPALDAKVDVLCGPNYAPLLLNGQANVPLVNVQPFPVGAPAVPQGKPVVGDGREWLATLKLGEGTGSFDSVQNGYPIVFRTRITGGPLPETYATAFVKFE